MTTAKTAHWAYLAHAKAELAAQKLIVLAVDADRNGQVLQEGLARRLGRSRCQVLDYPTGKDLNDVLVAQGPQGAAPDGGRGAATCRSPGCCAWARSPSRRSGGRSTP